MTDQPGIDPKRLLQVGWSCDQAKGGDGRGRLCAHGYPCGPTYFVLTPEDAEAWAAKPNPPATYQESVKP